MANGFRRGQDVRVDVFGMHHRGHVLWHRRGWVGAVIEPDPLADYGAVGANMDPARTIVCVPEARVSALP